jgi:hypothetical protein
MTGNPITASRFARAVVICALLACFAALIRVPAAPAAEEVHFDPESPAGKEYALPLEQAREEAGVERTQGPSGGGPGTAGGGGGGTMPLFGEGIPPTGARGGSSSEDGAAGGGGQSGEAQGGPAGANGGSAGHRTAILTGTDSSYPLGSAALLVAAILAAGALLGLGLRAAERQTAH